MKPEPIKRLTAQTTRDPDVEASRVLSSCRHIGLYFLLGKQLVHYIILEATQEHYETHNALVQILGKKALPRM